MDQPQSMTALLMTGADELQIRQLPVPKAGPHEIVIRTAFLGICGTDVHLHHGKSFYIDNGFLKHPFIFGHEYTGTVVSRGAGAERVGVGSRVVGHCMVPCNSCDNCQRGRRNLCRSLREVGLRFIPGAAAEYVVVPETAVSIVPDNVSLEAATLVEPAVTAYHACERTRVGKADRVAVIGTGTLGMLSLMIAKLTARSVDVIGVAQSEMDYALELGATRVLRPEEAARDAYDVVIEASGVRSSMQLAIDLCDLGGRIALVGIPGSASPEVSQGSLVLKDISVHGILHGIDYYGLTLDLLATGKLDTRKLVARIGGVEEAGSMFADMSKPDRSRPKYLIRFRGE
ncbi:zinc-dependent alcohol dehydrogenase [Shinella sumterensis]|uniref:zinc-dependent alcohol dehydrogenase n=1 Tax=Shinella sumterensis TaxID=1967501 RepID=UPI003F8422C9